MVNADYPLGPHERWLYGPGKVYDLPGLRLDDSPSLSCLAEFATGVTHPAAALASLLEAGGITMIPRLPVIWQGGGFRPHFLPVLLEPASPTEIAAHDPGRLAALLGQLAPAPRHLRLNFPLRSETINLPDGTEPAMGPAPGLTPGEPLVVLAVIDHGIAFAHQALGGRMDYCWSQSALAEEGQALPFGREFTRQTIAALREQADEETIYAQAGLLGGANRPPMPLGRAVAHGTHVLGTAAAGGPDHVRLIGVDLPATALWDTSGFGTEMALLAALHYVFDRADKIAAAHGLASVPVVVNISLGWSGGPHDGSSAIEAALSEMITHRRTLAPTALTLPSGNMFGDMISARLTPAHFAQGAAELRWFAPPCDMTSSFAEIWLPGPPEGHVFTLTAPSGEVTTLEAPGFVDVVAGGRIVGLAMLDHPRQSRWRVSFCLAPTEPKAPPPPGHAAAPAGEWRIGIRRPAEASGEISVRIQRDVDHAQGNTGARQSRLIDADYLTHDATGAPAQRDGAGRVCRFDGLNGLATQAVSLNVGGRVARLGRAARYSSAGPLGGRGVDLSAPSDRGVALPGVLSWGTRSGSWSAQSGTSSAAPEVARRLAEVFLTQGAAGPVADNYLSLLQPLGAPVYGDPDAPDGPTRLGQFTL